MRICGSNHTHRLQEPPNHIRWYLIVLFIWTIPILPSLLYCIRLDWVSSLTQDQTSRNNENAHTFKTATLAVRSTQVLSISGMGTRLRDICGHLFVSGFDCVTCLRLQWS